MKAVILFSLLALSLSGRLLTNHPRRLSEKFDNLVHADLESKFDLIKQNNEDAAVSELLENLEKLQNEFISINNNALQGLGSLSSLTSN